MKYAGQCCYLIILTGELFPNPSYRMGVISYGGYSHPPSVVGVFQFNRLVGPPIPLSFNYNFNSKQSRV